MIASNWKDMPEGKEKYQMYLASREWAEKRDGVRKRSGGICERCNWNKSDHVHHKTYIRKYNEKPYDLQALCKGCHDFTHNKSDVDPLLEAPVQLIIESGVPQIIRSVYLAGKITGTEWRDEIVEYHEGDWTDENHSLCSCVGPYEPWPESVKCLPIPDGRVLSFTGPFWEPGASNGEVQHLSVAAMTAENPDAHGSTYERRQEVRKRCYEAISHSDLVFAWIDSPTAHGTIAEITYARAKGKLVVVAFPTHELAEEMWFINEGGAIIKDTAKEAWDALMSTGSLFHEQFMFPPAWGLPKMSAGSDCECDRPSEYFWYCPDCEKSVRSVVHHLHKNGWDALPTYIESLSRSNSILFVRWSEQYAGTDDQLCKEYYFGSEKIAKLITDFWRDLVGEEAKVFHTTQKEKKVKRLEGGGVQMSLGSEPVIDLGEDYVTAKEFGANANGGKGANLTGD